MLRNGSLKEELRKSAKRADSREVNLLSLRQGACGSEKRDRQQEVTIRKRQYSVEAGRSLTLVAALYTSSFLSIMLSNSRSEKLRL